MIQDRDTFDDQRRPPKRKPVLNVWMVVGFLIGVYVTLVVRALIGGVQ